jgi:hypothetical protein
MRQGGVVLGCKVIFGYLDIISWIFGRVDFFR